MIIKFALVALIVAVCPLQETTQETKKVDSKVASVFEKMQGTWVAKSGEQGGQELPDEALTEMELTIKDKSYEIELPGGQTDEGDLSIAKVGKKHHHMDIQSSLDDSANFKCLLKFEKGTMTVCYEQNADEYPDKFETADTVRIRFTFEKKKDKNKDK